MKELTLFIDHLLQQAEHQWQLKLCAQWPTIMGDLAKRARFERVMDSTIVIGVYDSHWLHELHALSRMILQRINNALSESYPAGFTLKQARFIWVAPAPARRRVAAPTQPVSRAPRPVTIPGYIHEHAGKAGTLSEALVAYYLRCKQEHS